MEKDISFNFDDIYTYMDEKDIYTYMDEKEKLINKSTSYDPFSCSYICNSLFNCFCFFLSE